MLSHLLYYTRVPVTLYSAACLRVQYVMLEYDNTQCKGCSPNLIKAPLLIRGPPLAEL